MSQFNFNLGALHIQIDGREAARAAAPRRAPVAGSATAVADAAGPGWFESSWELVRGLEVREGLPGDAQLHEWLEACLRGMPSLDAQWVAG